MTITNQINCHEFRILLYRIKICKRIGCGYSMESKRYVSEIFVSKPLQWGLRGDPYLWDDL